MIHKPYLPLLSSRKASPCERWCIVHTCDVGVGSDSDIVGTVCVSNIRRLSSGLRETTFFAICPHRRSRRVAARKFCQILGIIAFISYHLHASVMCSVMVLCLCEGSLCLSVHRSFCLSVKRVNCDKMKETSAQILIRYERMIHLFFLIKRMVDGDVPFYLKLGARLTNPFKNVNF